MKPMSCLNELISEFIVKSINKCVSQIDWNKVMENTMSKLDLSKLRRVIDEQIVRPYLSDTSNINVFENDETIN